MGFLDKAKAAAVEATAKAKEGVEDVQTKRELSQAYNELGKVAFELVESGGNRTTRDRLIPSCLFTVPGLAMVGHTEATAKSAGLNVRVAQTPAPLGRNDRGVAEDFLQGGETSAVLEPPTRERVPQLMDVEALNLCFPSHQPVHRVRVPDSHESSDSSPQLVLDLRRQWNAPHLPRLGPVKGPGHQTASLTLEPGLPRPTEVR